MGGGSTSPGHFFIVFIIFNPFFKICDAKTEQSQIEESLRTFLARPDIGIVLITQVKYSNATLYLTLIGLCRAGAPRDRLAHGADSDHFGDSVQREAIRPGEGFTAQTGQV